MVGMRRRCLWNETNGDAYGCYQQSIKSTSFDTSIDDVFLVRTSEYRKSWQHCLYFADGHSVSVAMCEASGSGCLFGNAETAAAHAGHKEKGNTKQEDMQQHFK